MVEPLISVVVPVYNVEDYLARCVDTITRQTYKRLEIILVDDGSTDRSGAMCDDFARQDDRIEVIHKINGGLSDARNVGIDRARGDFITFIDSDDSVELDMVEYLLGLIDRFGVDVSLSSHTVVFDDHKKILGDGREECLTAEECIRKMLYHRDVDTSAWAKLYRREIFDAIRYPVGRLFEDIATTYKTFIAGGRVACGYVSKYNYFVRGTSIVRAKFSARKFDLLDMTDGMAREVVERYPSLARAAMRRRVYARFSTLNQLDGVEGYVDERRRMIDFIKEHRREIMSDGEAPLRDKAAILCLALGEGAYHFAWRLFKHK
ncbi:MAG: glycosyltransferase [Selenomonadaceae bacterium]|nr:glycosyltransferase [Selenomonadaceae bacterium]